MHVSQAVSDCVTLLLLQAEQALVFVWPVGVKVHSIYLANAPGTLLHWKYRMGSHVITSTKIRLYTLAEVTSSVM